MKQKIATIVASVSLVFGLLSGGSALAWNGGSGGGSNAGSKVTLCHATSSNTNPYVQITVNAHGAYHGHYSQHTGGIYPTSGWGDIIPPFTFNGQTYSLNWTSAGQAIFNNGCQVSTPGQGGGGQKDCDNDYDNSPAAECQQPQQKDCDNDYDNSPASECATGGTGGGGNVTPPVTTPPTTIPPAATTTTQVVVTPAVSTTTTPGQGAGEVTTPIATATPSGGVNAGGGMESLSFGSLAGFIVSLGSLAFGARRFNRHLV